MASASSCALGASIRLIPAMASAVALAVGGLGIGVPARGRGRRPHRLADEGSALLRTRIRRGAGQNADVAAIEAEAVEQPLQAELRVLGVSRVGGGLRRDGGPAVVVERLVEPRQHDGALRQIHHRAHQLGGGRNGAGDAGDDDRATRAGRR